METRKAAGSFVDAPFYASRGAFSLPAAPDYLESGDFNADGHADLLTASNGGSSLYVSAGDGKGNFIHTTEFTLPGSITALAVGEIGRRDGQTDVAVSVQGGKGSMLLVFENPQGAFVHGLEFIQLPSPAADLAIGNLDTDYFGDIVAASGNRLTFVRGRGHVSPWDSIEGYDIKRPTAIVETRSMPFNIAALTSGNFTEKRGRSLAILTTDGAVVTLDSPVADRRPTLAKNVKGENLAVPVRSGSKRLSKFKAYAERMETPGEAGITPGNVGGKVDPPDDASPGFPIEYQTTDLAVQGTNLSPESREKAMAGFLRSISPADTAPLAQWKLETIVRDAKLANAAASLSLSKLVKVRVSDSGRDELAFIDSASNQIHLMIRENLRRNSSTTANEIVSLDVDGSAVAIRPMRLNSDALSDLVVLRQGASEPSVILTSPAATFVVNTTSDEDDGSCGASCSFREAIQAANNSNGVDTITFSIGSGFRILQPESALPRVEYPVTIDATTQPGFSGVPIIEVFGNLAGEGSNGLDINTSDSVVRGLAVTGFEQLYNENDETYTGGAGIAIFNFVGETFAGFNIIEGNYLGNTGSGTQDRGNEASGLLIYDSDDNFIGGVSSFARNVLSGNGDAEVPNGENFGTGLTVIDGRSTFIFGNFIGLNSNGNAALANSAGIHLSGADNLVGSDQPGSGNTISGNRHLFPVSNDPEGCLGDGVLELSPFNLETGEWVTENSTFKGNRIGTNAAGTSRIGNCRSGIYTSPRNTATIGSVTSSGRNIVSGNSEGGIICSPRRPIEIVGGFLTEAAAGPFVPEGSCRVGGNNVGTDVTGSIAIPNDYNRLPIPAGGSIWTVNLFGALGVLNTETFSTIGGTSGISPDSCTGFCNLVSGNANFDPSSGSGFSTTTGIVRAGRLGDVGIWNNYVGTNRTGTEALPNDNGIAMFAAGTSRIGDALTGQGGNQTSLGNLISGNRGFAITSSSFGDNGSLSLFLVYGNLIGTDRTGSTAIPNADGIQFYDPRGAAVIGGSDPITRNVISGNTGSGIIFLPGVPAAATVNNYIGVNKNGAPLGNGRDGVELRGEFDHIGDTGLGNVIAYNGRNGITVSGYFTDFAESNRIRFNSIHSNGALGIDLSASTVSNPQPDGVTENDCQDSDNGANKLQNYPILTTPIFNQSGTVTVGGAFGSEASKTYTLDFYSNSSPDSSNYGEGETYIGSHTVTTDSSGRTAFLFSSTGPVSSDLKISATATDSDGNTSEFSCYAGECSVSGALTEQESAMSLAGGSCPIGFFVNINTDESDPNPADGICDVDFTTTGEQCSLRAAIQTTNVIAGTDYIYFNIPGGGIQTILVLSDLPPITEKVFINATFQPGYAGTPVVEVNGAATSITSNGFVFAAGSDDSLLTGLTINRFGDSGVLIQANDVDVTKCYIGIFADGITEDPAGKQRRGVLITGARNTIGGERDAAEPSTGSNNLLVGNSVEQIKIIGTSAVGNTVLGNSIGFTLSDTERSRLSEADGIVLDAGSSGNHVGGNGDIMLRNVIQGQIAVMIRESDGNFVTNNGIGNSAAGVAIFQGANNTIGGIVRSENEYTDRNLIANNIIGVILSDFFEIPAEFTRNSPDVDDKDCKGASDERKRRANSRRSSAGGTIRTTGNKILGNLIGIRSQADPIDDYSNCVGVVISEASGNFVGSDVDGYLNFISGNKESGIIIDHLGTQNTIQRNYIGTTRTGTESHPNLHGVDIAGNVNFVRNNIIAGNTETGVTIERHVESDTIPTGNVVENNRIGLSREDVMLPQEKGIYVQGIGNTIQNNNISGNSIAGIDILGDSNSILNNLIGTDRTGNEARPNTDFGILITSSNNTISGNTISGNGSGVTIIRPVEDPKIEASGNRLLGNYIGTNSAGTVALPGQTHGVAIANGADNNTIGGTTADSRNVISGNTQIGISLQPGAVPAASAPFGTKIQGNYIGTNAAGTAVIPNGIMGLEISETLQTLIGGFGADMPGARNVISGNSQHGIFLRSNTLNTRISGNYIGTASDGTSPLGNIGNGIFLQRGVGRTTIGGLEPNAGNTIAYNGKNGILMAVDAGQNNIIDPNSIFANALMGIDIGDDGHTLNDPLDADTGPNNLQNYPEIVSTQVVNDDVIVSLRVDSAPANSAYGMNGIYIEFFKADAGSEGERFIGSTFYTLADYNSLAPGTKTVNLGNIYTLGILGTDMITASATDANGNTSEFTPRFGPTAAGVSISGRIKTPSGGGLTNASVSITDSTGNRRTVLTGSLGYYRFQDVPSGETYVIAVSSKRYTFSSQIVAVNDDLTDVDFVGSENSP
ncbi:MAG: CSLREA domain-containing protein [Acidobacteria bacterium]|nr:CSLREA domain-containing protein [Acidobacteriota bacterium]